MGVDTLLMAIGLVLIIESIGPFLSPKTMRRAYLYAARMADRQMRIAGFAGMLLGLAIFKFAGG